MRFILLCTMIASLCFGGNLVRDFELYKLNAGDKRAPTLLLMGGIHGDEPGAYYSTDLFVRHYKIVRGSVWVVPVVNPHGMFANMRGMYGDMNRKFAALAPDDPDYQSIQKIKALLADKDVDISMHLHDGSGYWRPTYENSLFNPHKWGNCSVIDQPELSGAKYGNIESFVTQMVADINAHITNPAHRYHVHNTHTKAKNDIEQLKALTFFSLSLGKPALTNEASKELDVPTRVYYHLLAIESLLGQLGIAFERDFTLSVDSIKRLLATTYLQARIEEHIALPLDSLRAHISYFPLPRGVNLADIKITSQSHLLGLVSNKKGQVELKYGYRTLSTFTPQWSEFDNSLKTLQVKIDDNIESIPIGSIIYAKQSIEFEPLSEYRINVIGYVKPNDSSPLPNESGIKIYKKDFIPKYSLDTKAQIYRAEIYHNDTFSGMITISFAPPVLEPTPIYQAVVYKPAMNASLAQNKPSTSSPLPPASSPAQVATAEDLKKVPQSVDSKKIDKDIESSALSAKNAANLGNLADAMYMVKSQMGVNVRANPSTSSAIVAKLPQGAQVKLLAREGMWSKVTYAHMAQGYIISRALTDSITPSIVTPPTATTTPKISQSTNAQTSAQNLKALDSIITESTPIAPTQTPPKDTLKPQYAKVIVPAAFVRLAPSIQSAIVAKAPLGREMQIFALDSIESKEWVRVYYVFEGKSGKKIINGYVAKRLLKIL
ncbi:hypothetical protein LS71_004765 [Helicobacter jaachi]|uniref:SH3b domain-containing protein n=1 Tax=Helicobacter jaachi TaxID=1677920 RepID=A0A4U8TAK8_9HELI|nr:M99 family carboxypeptidase catalytic domain-containing protein [Helicobacter jaachi]TLD96906.1 hypothetical protein LS71_004765 [Helicobacter jaachi]